MADKLRFVTFNARGLADNNKRKQVFMWLKNNKADVALIQECHSKKTTEFLWKNAVKGKIWFSHGDTSSRGVLIWIRDGIELKCLEVMRDQCGRYILVKFEFGKQIYLVANVYGPNKDDPEFFYEFFQKIHAMTHDHLIIGGDFNTVLDNDVDRSVGSHCNAKSSEYLNMVKEALELVDPWRELYPDRFGFTWHRSKPYKLHERLDWFFVSEELLQNIDRLDVRPGFRSDHSLVILDIAFQKFVRGPGFWKLNTALLHDQDYIQKMNNLLDIQLDQNYKSKKLKWEMLKMAVRASSIQFASHRQKGRKNKLAALEKKLKSQKDTTPELGWDYTTTHIRNLKSEIEELYAVKVQGAMLRARAKWENHGDKPTKYFLNLEKHNYNKKCIYRLKAKHDKMISGRENVLKEMTSFYSNLYKQENTGNQGSPDYVEGINIPKITDQMKQKLDEPITEIELSTALKNMKDGVAPGNDGIPPEFYKMFWSKIKSFMLELYEEIVKEGLFHLSARRGIITLIEKQGRHPLQLKNWRPISLLTGDLKLFSKVITHRLQTVVSDLIHTSQTGFMAGRFIGENIIKLLNMIDYCNNNKQSGILISFDFEKAFDKISWKALFRTLELFNFGDYFINLVRTLYNKPMSCVMNAGFTGDYFTLERSTRQGDPSSALLFALVVELLGIKIRTRVDIKGIQLDKKYELKAAQYADDIWTFLEPNQQNVNNLLEEMQKFESFSGLNINYEKSIAMIIGPLRDSDPKFYTIKSLCWAKREIKILGIHIHNDVEVTINLNYNELLHKLDTLISIWEKRQLNLIRKITVFNTLIASTFAYRFMVLPSPDSAFFTWCKNKLLDF